MLTETTLLEPTGIEIFGIADEINQESLDAYRSVKPMESKIFDAIAESFAALDHDHGQTAFECAELMGALHQSVSTACTKLTKREELERTAYVRRNSSGRNGRVLVLPGAEFTPRPGDKHSPEEVKQKAPPEVAACVRLAAVIEDMKEQDRIEDLRMLKYELLRIAAMIDEEQPAVAEAEAATNN